MSVGISKPRVTLVNGNLTCSFVRDNTLNFPGFYKIKENVKVYLITAYGSGIINSINRVSVICSINLFNKNKLY